MVENNQLELKFAMAEKDKAELQAMNAKLEAKNDKLHEENRMLQRQLGKYQGIQVKISKVLFKLGALKVELIFDYCELELQDCKPVYMVVSDLQLDVMRNTLPLIFRIGLRHNTEHL